jgi:1,4-alpha-glucan branching enzyme
VANHAYQFSIVNKGDSLSNPGGIFTRVDAYARQVESAEDNARGIIVDWEQQWSEFATPKFEDLIIYEAHVGSFAGLNDHLNISTYATFADFETKLKYIRDLGFNALQLLPIGQVDGIDGEGYGATNLFAPHNGYGTPAQLRSLVIQLMMAGFILKTHLGMNQYGMKTVDHLPTGKPKSKTFYSTTLECC